MVEEIDAKTAERISSLAKSLKELHIVATAEEAYARAREIILGTKKKTPSTESAAESEKTIKELLEGSNSFEEEITNIKKELEKLKKEATKANEESQRFMQMNDEDLKDIKKELSEGIQKHQQLNELVKKRKEIDSAT
ncbi:MAG: hypothetical protein QXU88_01805 [Candidatus Woesearchaeota archaeon]